MAEPIVPEGFQLDASQSGLPPAGIPEGFSIDPPEQPQQQTAGEFASGAGQSLLQGATLGFADEIQSVIAAAVAAPFITDKTFGQLMTDARASLREEQEKFREQNPATSLGLELAGGLATGGVGLARTGAAKAGTTLAGNVGRGVGTGVATGGAAGAGFADEEQLLSEGTLRKGAEGAVVGGVAGGVLSGIIGKFAQGSRLKKDISQRLEAGETDSDLAKYIVSGSGKVKNDPVAQDAIRQGLDEGVLSAIKGSTPTDRLKMREQLKIFQKGKQKALEKDPATGRMKSVGRAGDVAGNSALERFRFIQKVNKEAGEEINKVAISLKGQPLDARRALEGFSDSLDELGVTLKQTDKGLKADYSNSILSPGDRGPMNEVIRQVERISKNQPDAFGAHQLKRVIDNNVTFGKSKTGISGDAERALKGFRANLDEALDTTFDSYNQANIKYRDTITVLDELQGAVGKKIDLKAEGADSAMGTVLRRLMSNQVSRQPITNAVTKLDDISAKYGAKFDDNIEMQALFADELDRLFKPTARTSFAGQIGQEIERTAQQGAGQTVQGIAIKKVGEVGKEALGINEEGAFRAIEKVLQ